MDVYCNGKKISKININPGNTLGENKVILNGIASDHELLDYDIDIYFNNGTKLDPIVMKSDKYDNVTFHAHADLIENGKVIINLLQPKNIELGSMEISKQEWDGDLDPNEIVIPKTLIKVRYDLRLNKSWVYLHPTMNSIGFTRMEISQDIMRIYNEINAGCHKNKGVEIKSIDNLVLNGLYEHMNGLYTINITHD